MSINYDKDLKLWLTKLGFSQVPNLYHNLIASILIEHAIKNDEGLLTQTGALVVNTSPYTGRSPKDKYIVDYCDPDIWLGEGTQLISLKKFDILKCKVIQYLEKRDVYIRDVVAGAKAKYQTPIRIITEFAWENLASNNLFLQAKEKINPEFTLIAAPGFEADPIIDGIRANAFIMIDFSQKIILIGGSKYAGEIKKSVFTIMNYKLPKQDILSLHCSANVGKVGDVALFFGLSGTGKTTLSSDPDRMLIGDDEHGWSEEGIFNIEGGCYAKTIKLNKEFEPLIWEACHKYQTLLENVPLSYTRIPDFDNNGITENTRAAYPLSFIPNSVDKGYAGHPKHIFLLTADAFGVLPPIARLNIEQAIYYFLSGYTSKLAGTERGLGKEPEATFSACFGAPFLPLHPEVYAKLLKNKLRKHSTKVWLLNTGWIGGKFGVGYRISLPHTRTIIRAVLANELNDIKTIRDPIFDLEVPQKIEGLPGKILFPEQSWTNRYEYQETAKMLVSMFKSNFTKYQLSSISSTN
ncbi:MAG: phosphoenolpyruvate carboxykinase (ATP) [Anaerolineaceae bacterium]|nr:phosphoenolpyruvate carboxykinase (ATP) [Anaerolineaceae bacterium]